MHNGTGSQTPQRTMSLAAAIKKGQEQFVDDTDKYEALRGVKAWLVSEQKEVDVASLWTQADVMVLVAARSMG